MAAGTKGTGAWRQRDVHVQALHRRPSPSPEARRRSLFVIKTDRLDEAGVDRTAAALERVFGAA